MISWARNSLSRMSKNRFDHAGLLWGRGWKKVHASAQNAAQGIDKNGFASAVSPVNIFSCSPNSMDSRSMRPKFCMVNWVSMEDHDNKQ